MGCGACSLPAQALSKSMSGGKTRFEVIRGPFVDGALLRADPREVRFVGGARSFGGGAVIGDGSGECGFTLAVQLLELPALLLSVAGLAFLHDEQQPERDADGEPGDPLDVEQPEDHSPCSRSASNEAPSRLAVTLNRPTGPPASSPTITTIMAAMKPPKDQPKMVTIVCSSAGLQPPHISNATMNPAAAPQNMPAAEARSP
jgi:hypothetical protein